MKLFLASQDLGNFATALQEIIGEKKHALVISNARDYYNDNAKIAESAQKTLVNLGKLGLTAERIDLRSYFGKPTEVSSLIKQKNVGLIFSIGGSVICLATAMHESGMDEIIRQGVVEGEFVYGGYSAGSMVTVNDLSLYQITPKPNEELPLHYVAEVTKKVYGVEPYKRGLGLIPKYIMPHMNRSDCADAIHERLNKIAQAGAEAICLNDADVFVADEAGNKVLRGGKNEKS